VSGSAHSDIVRDVVGQSLNYVRLLYWKQGALSAVTDTTCVPFVQYAMARVWSAKTRILSVILVRRDTGVLSKYTGNICPLRFDFQGRSSAELTRIDQVAMTFFINVQYKYHGLSYYSVSKIQHWWNTKFSYLHVFNARQWYGILGFNVPLNTVTSMSFRRRGPWALAVMCTSHSHSQRHNNPLNPRCFCLQRSKRDGTSS